MRARTEVTERFQTFGLPVDDQHLVAVGQEAAGDPFADPARRPGDEDPSPVGALTHAWRF